MAVCGPGAATAAMAIAVAIAANPIGLPAMAYSSSSTSTPRDIDTAATNTSASIKNVTSCTPWQAPESPRVRPRTAPCKKPSLCTTLYALSIARGATVTSATAAVTTIAACRGEV